jgi:Flp pilus assembly pilin Flp
MLDRIFSRISYLSYLGFTRAASGWRRVEGKLRDERGAITIEYILIIALMAFIIIALFAVLIWPFVEEAVKDLIERIKDAMSTDFTEDNE